jgi:predicted DNA-binding transcriptional regulator YafY
MPVEDSDHGAREHLARGPEIEVLSPAPLRQRISDIAAALALLHRKTDEQSKMF